MNDIIPLEPKPFLIIEPQPGWQAISITELWQFRDLLTTLAARDVKLRYRQTALGAVWVILQPLMAAGIFSMVFGRVAKLPSDGVPYFLFAYAGLLGWNVFNSTLGKASGCLVGNAQLVSKVYFPRLVLPLSTVFSSLIDFGVALAMLVVMLLFSGSHPGWGPGWGLLLLPVWLALLLLLSLGIGLMTSAMMVTYRDVQYVLPVLTQFLMYASPVAYALSAVPTNLRTLYHLNPLAILLEGFRWSLLGVGNLDASALLYAVVVSVGVFIWGAFAFKKMERKFADVI